MKILYLYQYFGTPQGSWSTRAYEFARRWVKAGCKVAVITTPHDKSDTKAGGEVIRKYVIEGIEVNVVRILESNRLSTFRRSINFLLFSVVASWIVLTKKYDVIIASSGPLTVGLPGLLAKFWRKKPFIFEVRDLWPDGAIQLRLIRNKQIQRMLYCLEDRCYRNADLIIPCSTDMEAYILNKCRNAKTLVIENASDDALFNDPEIIKNFQLPDWAQEKSLFVYAGSIGLTNDCRQIVDCHQFIDDPDIHLVLIGDGQELELLKSTAKTRGYTNVHFLGLMPKTKVIGWLKSAVAALVTSKDIQVLHAFSPNRLFDAFAAGLPVIQNTRGWIYELVLKENCGYNVPPGDPEAMANAILKLKEEPVTRNIMAANAYRLGQTTYNRDQLAAKMLKGIKAALYNDKN